MSAVSGWLEQKILGVTLLGSSYTTPATLWVCLATSVASDCSSPAHVTEVTTNVAYSRLPFSPGDGKMSAPTSGPNWTVVSSQSFTFSAATTNWPLPVYYVCLASSSTIGQGEFSYYGLLDASRTVLLNDVLSFSAGSLAIIIN
jgi:hypothetical protein